MAKFKSPKNLKEDVNLNDQMSIGKNKRVAALQAAREAVDSLPPPSDREEDVFQMVDSQSDSGDEDDDAEEVLS